MYPIYAYGDEEQRRSTCPSSRRARWIGCFGLTEPDCGSDPGGMRTRAREGRRRLSLLGLEDVDHQLADRRRVRRLGQARRRRRSAASSSRRASKGLARRRSRASSRCAPRSPARSCMDEVVRARGATAAQRLGPEGAVRLPQPRPLRHRLGRAWARPSSAGTPRAQYTLDRKQFGRPLAANQLVQKKLADMQTEIALGLQASPARRPADRRGQRWRRR